MKKIVFCCFLFLFLHVYVFSEVKEKYTREGNSSTLEIPIVGAADLGVYFKLNNNYIKNGLTYTVKKGTSLYVTSLEYFTLDGIWDYELYYTLGSEKLDTGIYEINDNTTISFNITVKTLLGKTVADAKNTLYTFVSDDEVPSPPEIKGAFDAWFRNDIRIELLPGNEEKDIHHYEYYESLNEIPKTAISENSWKVLDNNYYRVSCEKDSIVQKYVYCSAQSELGLFCKS